MIAKTLLTSAILTALFAPFESVKAATVSLPVARFTATPTSGPAPLTVSFDGSGCYVTDRQNYYIIGYDWYFGEGSDSAHDNMPQHTYSSPGVYVVSLAAVQNANDWSVTYQRGLPVYDTIRVTGSAAVRPAVSYKGIKQPRAAWNGNGIRLISLDGRILTPAGNTRHAGAGTAIATDGRLMRRVMTIR